MTLLPKKGATASSVMHRELGFVDCSDATAQATTASLLVGSAENGKLYWFWVFFPSLNV